MKLLFISFLVTLILHEHGVSGVDSDEVSVNEGDSVTLCTAVQADQQENIKWYFNDTRIAQIITADPSETCIDGQCKDSDERFRDRLKLDHQTGSLTVMNITNTHSGPYKLLINSEMKKIFSVTVHGVSAAGRDEVKRKEGESVTLDLGDMKKTNDVITWFYNGTCIAKIPGDPNTTCTDVQCEERLRDRLTLDHQTGSLTIMNTRTTDSGLYELKIINNSNNNSSFSVRTVKRFDVSVIDSGLSSAAAAGIVVGVLLLVAAVVTVAVIYYRRRRHTAVPQNEDNGL